jgi:hypothetical protein
VPEPLGFEVSLGVVAGGGVDGIDGLVDGAVEDGGDADGMRSPGRSPTRSVRDSLQAVSIPTPSARAHRPVIILFMIGAPPCGVASQVQNLATGMPPSRLDRVLDNYYQCG